MALGREVRKLHALFFPIPYRVGNDRAVAVYCFESGDGNRFSGDIHDVADSLGLIGSVRQKRIRTFVDELRRADTDEFPGSNECGFSSFPC